MDIRGLASKRGEGEKRRRKGGVLLLREGKEGRGGKGRRKGKGLSFPRKKFLAPPLTAGTSTVTGQESSTC